MKKIIIGVVSVLIISATVVLILISNRTKTESNSSKTEEKLYESILNIKSVDEYKDLISSIKNTHYESKDGLGATIYDVEFLSKKKSSFTIMFNDEKEICHMDAYFYINDYDAERDKYKPISSDVLKKIVYDSMKEFCLLFDIDTIPELHIQLNDGSFELLESLESYEEIIKGKGIMNFSVRDKEGSYWLLTLCASDEVCEIDISRDYVVEDYLDYFANISLYKSEG